MLLRTAFYVESRRHISTMRDRYGSHEFWGQGNRVQRLTSNFPPVLRLFLPLLEIRSMLCTYFGDHYVCPSSGIPNVLPSKLEMASPFRNRPIFPHHGQDGWCLLSDVRLARCCVVPSMDLRERSVRGPLTTYGMFRGLACAG